MEESSLFLGEDHLNDLTDVMFDAAGKDRTGSMTFDDLRQVVEKHPSVMENLTLRYNFLSDNTFYGLLLLVIYTPHCKCIELLFSIFIFLL